MWSTHRRMFTCVIMLFLLAGVQGQQESYEDYEDDYEYDENHNGLASDIGERSPPLIPTAIPDPQPTELPALSLDDLTTRYDDEEYDVDYDEEVEQMSVPDGPDDATTTTEATTTTTTTTTTTPPTTTTQTTTTTTPPPTTTTPPPTTTTSLPTTTTPAPTSAATTPVATTQPPPGQVYSAPIERGDQGPLSENGDDTPVKLTTAYSVTKSPTTAPTRATRFTQTTTLSRTTRRSTTPMTQPTATQQAVTRPAVTRARATNSGTEEKQHACPEGWSATPDKDTRVTYCVKMVNCTITSVEDAIDACEAYDAQLAIPIPNLEKKLESRSSLSTTLLCKKHPLYCCKPGWSIFCSQADTCSCYKSTDKPKHWKKGSNCCRKWDANLVTIESKAENFFVAKFVRQSTTNCDLVWLGIKKAKKNGGYESVAHETPSYFNWAQNGEQQDNHDHCVAMVTKTAKWTHTNCYRERAVVCEGAAYVWLDKQTTQAPEETIESQTARRRRRHHRN